MSSLELEAGKLELIREIVNINSSTALESLRKYMKEVLNKNSHSIPTAADSKLLTKRMLAKYAGSWKDNRDSDEINDDIYASIYVGYLFLTAFVWVFLKRLRISLLASRYRCGRCGQKLREKGVCPHCGAINE